jgi:HEAT repeat protein
MRFTMKTIKLVFLLATLSLLYACDGDLRKAEALYQRAQNIHHEEAATITDPLGEAIQLLEGYLSRHHDDPAGTLLLWRCYLQAGHPRAQAMAENMRRMPERVRDVFYGEVRREREDEMRARMVYLFGELGSTLDVKPLIKILERDQSINVQRAAAEVLAKRGASAAIPLLLQKLGAEQPAARYYACGALACFPQPQIVTALLARLEDCNEAQDVRHQAAHALALMGQHRFDGRDNLLQQLERLLENPAEPADTRLLAAYSLAALGQPYGHDLAMANAKSDDAYLRGLAIITLGYIGDNQALPYLADALLYGNKALRLQAAEALGRLGDAKALPTLYKALDDPSDAVRDAANQSINRIKALSKNG